MFIATEEEIRTAFTKAEWSTAERLQHKVQAGDGTRAD
jgi:hypothetical protein